MYALLLLGVLALPVAEAVRRVHDWPVNDQFYPQVVGPGDKTTFYMPEKITSLKSYWRGEPSVKVVNAGELGLSADRWSATAKENSWSGTISVKSSEKDQSSMPWIAFTVPDEPSLASNVAKLRLELKTEFPQMVGSNTYQTMRREFVAESDLTLAPAGSGAQYLTLWVRGTGGCGGAAGRGGLVVVSACAQRRPQHADGSHSARAAACGLGTSVCAAGTFPASGARGALEFSLPSESPNRLPVVNKGTMLVRLAEAPQPTSPLWPTRQGWQDNSRGFLTPGKRRRKGRTLEGCRKCRSPNAEETCQ